MPMTSPATSAPSEAKAAAQSVPAEASRARAKPAFRRFAALGLCARGIIYVLLAVMAADIALTRSSPAQPSGTGALTEIGKQPAGRPLLALLAVGLAGYGAWRALQALSSRRQDRQPQDRQPRPGDRSDWRQHGQDMKVVATRAGWAAVAVLYFGLCVRAVTLAAGSSATGTSGGASSNPRPLVGVVLRWPGGPAWLGLAGVALAVGGAALAIWGLAHDYSEVLSRDRMSGLAFAVARATGIAGEVTRGLLIVLVSVFLLTAAVTNDPAQAKSLGQALRAFDRLPPGPGLLLAAAAGLAAFAAYSVFEALYRDL
jgi:hypothetical protein